MRHNRTLLLTFSLIIAVLAVCWRVGASTDHHEHDAHAGHTPVEHALRPPSVLRTEHEHLHTQLKQAIDAGGQTGEAAKAVAAHLKHHFVEEEAYAMPPIGLLQALAQGKLSDDMQPAIAMAEKLKTNYARMLQEHQQIVAALVQLAAVAEAEGHPDHVRFAHDLIHHAQMEEQVLYPATIVIGDYLRMKLEQE